MHAHNCTHMHTRHGQRGNKQTSCCYSVDLGEKTSCCSLDFGTDLSGLCDVFAGTQTYDLRITGVKVARLQLPPTVQNQSTLA